MNEEDAFLYFQLDIEEDAVLIPKNRGENFSGRCLHSEFFGAG